MLSVSSSLVSAHEESVARVEPGSANSDRCPPAAVTARMEEYVHAVVRQGRGEADEPAPRPFVEAARATLRWFNDQLLELQPGPVDESAAYGLTVKRDWALAVLVAYGGKGEAKRQQLELLGGQPLAICTGGRHAMFEKTKIGVLRAWTKGCFRVFDEKPNIAGKKWPPLCPDCQPREGHRNPYRDGRRALHARVKTLQERYGLEREPEDAIRPHPRAVVRKGH
jgi:hypothetical protein